MLLLLLHLPSLLLPLLPLLLGCQPPPPALY
jgi:hypothetical protein